jgi:CDK inhibitor PHO81
MGVCINLKYPTASQRSNLQISNTSDAHLFVERILKLVYDTATRRRSIIFSSFNPSICSIINWKQPNYGVFFGTRCGYVAQEGPWGQSVEETDIRCNSIKEAVKFAKSSNLLGLICEAAPIVNDSYLTLQVSSVIIINRIKESGLILATCGSDNEKSSNIKKQELMGVDAIISHRILRYNNS